MVTEMPSPTSANPIAGHERCVEIAVTYRQRMDALDVAGAVLGHAVGDFLARERLRGQPDTWLIDRAVKALDSYERALALPDWPEAVSA